MHLFMAQHYKYPILQIVEFSGDQWMVDVHGGQGSQKRKCIAQVVSSSTGPISRMSNSRTIYFCTWGTQQRPLHCKLQVLS